MASNVLLVGLATDGPSNEVHTFGSSAELLEVYGGSFLETFSVSPTGTTVPLSYLPQSQVQPFLNGQPYSYFTPAVIGKTFAFGSMGGTGVTLGAQYTPYLGTSDLVLASRYLFENLETDVHVCRIGGASSSFDTGTGWRFSSNYRGAKFNSLSLTSTATSLAVNAFESFPPRTYTGTTDEIVKQVNMDSSAGLCPLFVESYTQTTPTLSATLTGGLNGVLDYGSVREFLINTTIPDEISQVVFLGEVDYASMSAISDFLEDPENQTRLFWAQAPSTDDYLLYTGAAGKTGFNTRNTYTNLQNFDALVHNSTLSATLGCSFSPATAAIYDNTQVGFTTYQTSSGTNGLRLFPASATAISISPTSTGGILSVGFDAFGPSLVVSAYQESTLISSYTTVATGFVGMEFAAPVTELLLTPATGSFNTIAIDDLRIGMVPSLDQVTDNIVYSARQLPSRHPQVGLFTGAIDIRVGQQLFTTHAVLGGAYVLAKNDSSITNKTLSALDISPRFTETQHDLLNKNGINAFRDWIGSGTAVNSVIMSDGVWNYNFANAYAQIFRISTPYLRRYLGSSLKSGSQSMIANRLRDLLLASLDGVTLDKVVVEVVESSLNVYMEGSVYNQILSLSFNVGN